MKDGIRKTSAYVKGCTFGTRHIRRYKLRRSFSTGSSHPCVREIATELGKAGMLSGVGHGAKNLRSLDYIK